MAYMKLLYTLFFTLVAMSLIFVAQMNSKYSYSLKVTSHEAIRDASIVVNRSIDTTNNVTHPTKLSTVYIAYYGFSSKFSGVKEGEDLGGCVATFKRSLLPEAKAVVINRLCPNPKKTIRRHADQIFVFFTMESPPFVRYNEKRVTFDNFDHGYINWTMSYRTDSDVFKPYLASAAVRSLISRNKEWVDMNLLRKTKLALWIVSDCSKTQGAILRMKYAKELMKAGLPLSTYGECFGGRIAHTELFLDNMRGYKFYLAFENALHCKDYITEKLWGRGIMAGRVPVIWGPSKEDVKKLAPPDSYIHTEDFDSPASLASYLLYLDKNDTAYREYFRWLEKPDGRTEAFAKLHENTGHERLCEMVLSGQPRKTIDSITDFVYGPETEECLLKKPYQHG